jgi:hypothetical protein
MAILFLSSRKNNLGLLYNKRKSFSFLNPHSTDTFHMLLSCAIGFLLVILFHVHEEEVEKKRKRKMNRTDSY